MKSAFRSRSFFHRSMPFKKTEMTMLFARVLGAELPLCNLGEGACWDRQSACSGGWIQMDTLSIVTTRHPDRTHRSLRASRSASPFRTKRARCRRACRRNLSHRPGDRRPHMSRTHRAPQGSSSERWKDRSGRAAVGWDDQLVSRAFRHRSSLSHRAGRLQGSAGRLHERKWKGLEPGWSHDVSRRHRSRHHLAIRL